MALVSWPTAVALKLGGGGVERVESVVFVRKSRFVDEAVKGGPVHTVGCGWLFEGDANGEVCCPGRCGAQQEDVVSPFLRKQGGGGELVECGCGGGARGTWHVGGRQLTVARQKR